jgi:hypothetical protein
LRREHELGAIALEENRFEPGMDATLSRLLPVEIDRGMERHERVSTRHGTVAFSSIWARPNLATAAV